MTSSLLSWIGNLLFSGEPPLSFDARLLTTASRATAPHNDSRHSYYQFWRTETPLRDSGVKLEKVGCLVKTVTQRHAAASLTDVQATCCGQICAVHLQQPQSAHRFPSPNPRIGGELVLLFLRTALGKATSSEVISQLQYPMCEARRGDPTPTRVASIKMLENTKP